MQRAVLVVVAATLSLAACRSSEPSSGALGLTQEARGEDRAESERPGWNYQGSTERRGKVDALAPPEGVSLHGSLRALGEADWPSPEPEGTLVERGPADGAVPLSVLQSPQMAQQPQHPIGAPLTGAQPGAVNQEAQPQEPQQRGDKAGDVPPKGGK